MKTVFGYLLTMSCVFLAAVGALVLFGALPPPADDAASESIAVELPETADIPQDENEDIDEPALSWREAHCAPPWYHPPEYLVPEKWHPANTLKKLKP